MPGAKSLHMAPSEQMKLDEAQRTKERLGFILLPKFYFFFVPWELLTGFAGDSIEPLS